MVLAYRPGFITFIQARGENQACKRLLRGVRCSSARNTRKYSRTTSLPSSRFLGLGALFIEHRLPRGAAGCARASSIVWPAR